MSDTDPTGAPPVVAQPPAADPLTAEHVPQHALGEPVPVAEPLPADQWPEATLAPPVAPMAEMDNTELAAVATALTDHVGQLALALDAERAAREAALKAEAEARTKDKTTIFTWLKRGGGFIAFDVVVTIAGLVAGFLLYGVVGTVQTQQAQPCYFYQLIVNNYDPASPARRLYKGGALAFDQAYLGMYTGALDLGCAGIKRPAVPTPLGAAVTPIVPVLPGAPTSVVPTPISPTPIRGR